MRKQRFYAWMTLFFLTLGSIRAQSVDSLVLIPPNPLPGQSISLAVFTTLTTSACSLSSRMILFEAGTFDILANYWTGTFAALCPLADTVVLGSLGPGMYQIHYTATEGGGTATASLSFQVGFPTAILDPERLDIRVYPNPFRDRLHVRSAQRPEGYRLLDVSGRLLLAVDHLESHSLQHLSAGVYVLHADFPDGRTAQMRIQKF